MLIRVDSLKERPRRLVYEEPVERFPELDELVREKALVFRGPVSLELTATMVGSLVEVEGRVAATVVVECGRCLNPVERQLELAVALSFTREAPAADEAAADHELSDDDIGLIPFAGDELDLAPAIAQELLMAVPQQVLCRDDCAGLCPVCGIDRNAGHCNCAPPVFHSGLAALRDFKVSKHDE